MNGKKKTYEQNERTKCFGRKKKKASLQKKPKKKTKKNEAKHRQVCC
jgi:hypothetical protein